MNTIIRRSPTDIDRVFDQMERAFGALWGEAAQPVQGMPIDVYERENALFVRASLPGMKPEEIEVSVENDVLTIRGEHEATWETEDAKVYRREHRYGKFTRSLRVPDGYRLDEIDASFENGVLTVRVPREEPTKSQVRMVPVRGVVESEKSAD